MEKAYYNLKNQHFINNLINERKYVDELNTEFTEHTNEFLKCLTNLTDLQIFVYNEDSKKKELDLSRLTDLKFLTIRDKSNTLKIKYPKSERFTDLSILQDKKINLKGLESLTHLSVFGDSRSLLDLSHLTNLDNLTIDNVRPNVMIPEASKIKHLSLYGNDVDFSRLPELEEVMLTIPRRAKERIVNLKDNKNLRCVFIYGINRIDKKEPSGRLVVKEYY